jgi:hypothetical protein
MTSHNHLEACGKITQEQHKELASLGQELNQLPPSGPEPIDERALAGVHGRGGGSVFGDSSRISSDLSERIRSAPSNASVAPPIPIVSVPAPHGSPTIPQIDLANKTHLERHNRLYQYIAGGATLGAISGFIGGQR